jgi:hypothetical protein
MEKTSLKDGHGLGWSLLTCGGGVRYIQQSWWAMHNLVAGPVGTPPACVGAQCVTAGMFERQRLQIYD